MMNPTGRSNLRYFHLSITAAGFITAFVFLINISLVNNTAIPIALLSFFIAFLIAFPIFIYEVEISLGQIVVIGSAILYGPSATTLSILIGTLISAIAFRFIPAIQTTRKNPLTLRNAALEASRLLLPLPIAFWLANPTFQISSELILFAAIYMLIHTTLILAEFSLFTKTSPATKIKFIGSVLLIQTLPLPFIILSALSFHDIGIGSLGIIAGLPTIIAILLNQTSKIRSTLDRRLSDLAALNEISNIIRYSTDLDSLLIAVHKQIKDLMGIQNFYVALYDENDDTIWYPISIKRDQHQNWPRRPLTDRLTDRVIRERRSIMLPKKAYKEMERIGVPIGKDPIQAWMGVPLITPDKILGCLCILTFNPKTVFTDNDLELLTTLSGQISTALENALLYAQMQQRSLQLEQLNQTSATISATLDPSAVFAEICRAAVQISGGQQSALYINTPPAKEAYLVQTHGLSKAFTQKYDSFQVIPDDPDHSRELNPADIVPNITKINLDEEYLQALKKENVLAYINFPFHTSEGKQACLSIFYEDPHAFPEEEIELLQTFVSQASMALANASLYSQTDQALQKSNRELRILEEVGRRLSEALRSDKLFDLILNYALEYTKSPWGSIIIYDSPTQTFIVKSHRGYTQNIDSVWEMTGIAGRAIQTQEAIISNDISKDPDFIDATGGKTRSQLSVPLIREDQTLGVITLESPNLNEYTQDEQVFIGQLADQAALAVLNAQLYDETQRWLNQQATLFLVSARIAANQNLDSIMTTVSQAFSAAMDSHLVGVYLWDDFLKTFILKNTMERESSGTSLPNAITSDQYDNIQRKRIKTGPLVLNQQMEVPEDFPICAGCQAVIFPLKVRGKMIGLTITHVSAERNLTEKELQLPESIALQCSISIQNATLFSDVAQGRDRLQAVLDAVGDGVLMIDANGVVTLGNSPIETITNTPIEEIQNVNLTALPSNVLNALGFNAEQAYELLVQTLKPHRAKTPPKHNYKYGEHFLERATAPVWGLDKDILGWVIVIRDVTEQHQINQTRELLTETLVHDLRSPVGAVKTTLDLIEDVYNPEDPDPIIPQSLQIAQRSIDRVLILIESLLDISQLESGSMILEIEDTDPSQIIKNTTGEMIPHANESGIILTHNLPDNLPPIKVDQNLIKRVLINLIDNAIKFTPEGGTVTVSAKLNPEDQLVVQVTDTGPGVPLEYRQKIFDRFNQIPNLPGRRRGTGLGLTLCQLAIEAHGGQIWVESNPERPGAVFAFTLPTAAAKTKQPT